MTQSRWIETEDGYVNLAHVVWAKDVTKRGDVRTHTLLTLIDGTHATACGGFQVDGRTPFSESFEMMIADIIPALPGQEALLVHCWPSPERPTEVFVNRYPVVGWRLAPVHGAIPEPILPTEASNTSVMILLADGRVLWGCDEEYVSIEEMKGAVLASEQFAWDQRAEEKAKAKLKVVEK